MITNQTHLNMLIDANHNALHDIEDNLTVQVSDANSLLGTHLIEGDWDEALAHLDTPEGKLDATSKNDPLGLFNSGSNKLTTPKSKNGAIFASLYVRATYPLIKKICDTSTDADMCDLMYVLSVIPHEEQLRLNETQRKIPYRSRAWTNDEYSLILDLFLKEALKLESEQSSSSLLEKCPSWVIPSAFSVTPLAMAAYNPDVPSSMLQKLCMLEPTAIDMNCKLFTVPTIPLIIAAASPVPPTAAFSDGDRDEVKRNRWQKVQLLMNKDWFYATHNRQSSSYDIILDKALPSPPVITMEQVEVACDEAMKRKEWELVRELLKQFTTGEELTLSLSRVQTELARHDQQVSKKLRKQEIKRTRDEWLHTNMGLIMYPVDAFMDIVYAIVPQRHDNSLVSPMS